MSLYSERAFFAGDYCQHCADRDEQARLERAHMLSSQAIRRSTASHKMALNNLLIAAVCDDIAGVHHA